MTEESTKRTRHVLGLSGGKDSAALAIYLKNKGIAPDIEYFFCDTGAELPEVYEFLEKLESYLGKEIERLNSGRDFEHHLKRFGYFLPSVRQRWCTRVLKLEPFEKWIGEDPVVSYIGIRADENRDGYISTKPTIEPRFPFRDDGIVREDVFRILEETVGIPEYYKWRKRSGCYFCFFQTKKEWRGLAENHPALFERAKAFEKLDNINGEQYTWVQGMSLSEVVESARNGYVAKNAGHKVRWQEAILEGDDDAETPCLICTL